MASRPKLRELAYMLGVYSNKTIPQTYINEFSNYELLLTVINKVNEIVERCSKYDDVINEIINYLDTLDNQVIEYLDNLKNTGYIAEVIKNTTQSTKHILIIGDSYTAGVGLPTYTDPANPPAESYGRLLQTTGVNIDIYASPGAGFYWVGDRGNFEDCLERWEGNKNSITDIYILGGSNDYSFAPNEQVLQSQIILTCNTARELYPNAQIHIGWLSQMNYQIDYKKWDAYMSVYKNTALLGKYSVIPNTEYLLKSREDISSNDKLHPTESGHQSIANGLYSYITNNTLNVVKNQNNIQLTHNSSVRCNNYTLNFAWNMIQNNNIITINSQQTFGFVFNSAFTISLSGQLPQAIYLGSCDTGLIWGRDTTDRNGIFPMYTATECNIPVEISYSGGTVSGTGKLVFVANNVFITLEYKTRASDYVSITPTQIDIAPFTATFNANFC